jgi:hypothetical protein
VLIRLFQQTTTCRGLHRKENKNRIWDEEFNASLWRVLYLDRQAFSERGKGPFDPWLLRGVPAARNPAR